MTQRFLAAFLAALLALTTPARALDIELISGNWQPINFFVSPFPGEEEVDGQKPSEIIGNDLATSGNFRIYTEQTDLGRAETAADQIAEIRDRGGEYLLTGRVQKKLDGSFLLKFTLYDTLTENTVGAYELEFSDANKRLAAHNVSNWVYEQIVNKAGVFHTKVAYVLRHGDGRNELKIADYDGHNRLTILTSDDNIISPAWSADGNSLLYVSFEQNKPIIYRQSLLTGGREIIANFKGSNSAPASAPDNRTVAAALTEHGGAQQIYLLTDTSKARLRDTISENVINTEPTFSPDGEHIVFTSNEAGSESPIASQSF